MAGRPSKAEQWLSEDGLSMLTYWKRNDLTDAEIAEKIGIKPKTLRDWKERHPPISAALKKGLEYAVKDAETALLEKFKKHVVEEEKIEMWQVPTGEYMPDGKPKMAIREQHVVKTKRTVMPDTTAIIFFLKAKAGWRDNTDVISRSNIADERRKELDELFKPRGQHDSADNSQ